MRAENTNQTILGEASTTELMQMAGWHTSCGDPAQAERCYQKVIEREPSNVLALRQLAQLLHSQTGRAREALSLLDAAIALQPQSVALHTSRAVVLNELEQRVEALESFAEACCLRPGDVGALYNLGLQYADACCPAQAEVVARHLIGHRPDWPAAHYLLLRALTALDADTTELDELYRLLIKSDPLNVSLRFAHGLMKLKTGDYAAGWDAQEWRWDIEPVKSQRLMCRQPRWAGGALDGRRLLVAGEQGFGDILQFSRFLPMLVERGAHVILQLAVNRAALARLLERIDGVQVVVGMNALPDFDLYCPLASLPYVFDTTVETIPDPSYLTVDEADVAAWTRRLAHLPRPWIGVCWAGSSEHIHNIRRSLPLCAGGRDYTQRQAREERILAVASRVADACGLNGLYAASRSDAVPSSWTMEPLLRRTEGSLVSLQVGPHARDVGDLPADLRTRMVSPLPEQPDFYDTACLIQALDEVITVDTSAAHLCGSIGQRGMIVMPVAPEWRWLERNGRSVWYPTMRLATQAAIASS